MAVIEGYTFAVDMQDRGVVPTLRQMKSAASAMKAEMRAGFETIQRGEGTVSAYNYKIQESQRLIETYKRMQQELRSELKEVTAARENEIKTTGSANDSTEKQYAKLVRNIENYQHQINRLSKQQDQAKTIIAQYNTGLNQSRQATQNVKNVMTSYINELKSEGNAFKVTKAQIESYKAQHMTLSSQYKAEVSESRRLSSEISRLQKQYRLTSSAVQKMKNAGQQETAEYKRKVGALASLREKISQTDSAMAKQIATSYKVKASLNEISRAERSITDGGVSRLSRAMNNLSANAQRATSHTRAWAQSVRGGFAAASMAMIPFGAAVGKSVQMSSELQAQWVTTKNLLVTGGEKVSDVTKTVGQMQRDASKYSKEYGFSQKEIADQYTELVKRGYTSESALGSMKSMLEAARASGDDFNDVVQSSSQVLDAFGLQGKTAGEQMKNTSRVVNSMAYSADMTATSFKDLGLAMSYVSASASQAGFSVEETSAAIGILSNSGVEASKAGTGLRKVINSILAPTDSAQAALQKVGLSIDDFKKKDGSLKSMSDIFKLINDHTKELGKADKGAFFKALFGTTGQQAGTILAQSMDSMAKGNKNLETLTENVKKAEKGNGYVHQLATKNMQSTQMEMKKLKMNIQDIAINLGNKLLPVVNDVARAMSDWVGSKDGQKAIKDFSDSISEFGKTIGHHSGSILSFLGGFVEGLSGTVKWAGKAVGAIGNLYGAVFKLPGMKGKGNGFAKFLGESTGAIVGVIGAFKLLKSVIGGMSAVRQDIKGMFHLNGIKEEQTKLDIENEKLQENIDLWKRHNEVSGGGSSLGSDITTSSSKSGKEKNKTRNTSTSVTIDGSTNTRMERSGRQAAGFFSRGFGKYIKVGMKGIADIAIMTFTGGILDFDIVAGVGKKLLSPFVWLAKKIPSTLKNPLKQMFGFKTGSVSSQGNKVGREFSRGVSRGTKTSKTNVLRSMFGLAPKQAGKHGAKAGRNFADNAGKSVKSSKGSKSANEIFSKSAQSAGKHGTKAGKSFADNVSKTVNNKRVNAKGLFKNVATDSAKSGVKSGTSFISSIKTSLTRTKTIPEIGKSLGGRLGGAATVAFGAVDLFKAVGSSNNKNRANNVGKSLGSTVGGAGGAAIGASLGSVVPGIGTAIGGLLGGMIGSVAGGKIGKSIGKAWPQIKKGASKTWKAVSKGFGKMTSWIGKQGSKFGKWLNKTFKPKKAKSKNSTGISAKDRKLVQQMTKAIKSYTSALKKLQKVKMKNYFSTMAKDIRKSKINKELSSMSKSAKQSVKSWKQLAKPIRQVSSSFRTLQKSIKTLSGRKNGFTALNSDVRSLYRTLRKNPFGKLISQQANIANKAMSGKKSGFVNEFNRQTKSMTRALKSFKQTFDRDWKDTWKDLSRPVSRNMKSAHKVEVDNFDDMESKRSKFSSSFLKGWNSWIDDVVSNFRKGFNKLPVYAQSAMKDIISRLNKGISGINSTISSFGGDKKLSSISYANGTMGGHPGGHMLVNDSVRPHWKELVLFPNGQAMLPQHRNTLIPNAPKGTQVLSGENTYKFMNSIGVHKYADGTLSDDEMSKLSDEFDKHPQEAAKKLVLKFTNWNSKVPIVADLGQASAVAFSRGIANVLKELMSEPANPGGAGVARWRPYIIRAFHELGLEPAEWKVRKLLKQIETESGGNPGISQQIHDKNSGGNESFGLLQFAASTWAADALPRHKNKASGYDQIITAIHVLENGGEGGWGNVGMGHGWAYGGFVNRQGLYPIAEGNKLESIIPMDLNKRPRALSLIDQTLDKMEADGGGTGGLRSRNAKSNSDNETNSYLKQAVTILAQIAGLNKQQIDAILSQGSNDMNTRRKRAQFYQNYGNDQRISDFMSY